MAWGECVCRVSLRSGTRRRGVRKTLLLERHARGCLWLCLLLLEWLCGSFALGLLVRGPGSAQYHQSRPRRALLDHKPWLLPEEMEERSQSPLCSPVWRFSCVMNGNSSLGGRGRGMSTENSRVLRSEAIGQCSCGHVSDASKCLSI